MDKATAIPTIVFIAGFLLLIFTDYWLGKFDDRPSGLPPASPAGTEPESFVPKADS